MDKSTQNEFSVEFINAEAGWLKFNVSFSIQTFIGRFSYVYDPLPDFKHWLEAIVTGVEQTSFTFDSEGYETTFNFEKTTANEGIFTISDPSEDSAKFLLQAVVPCRQLIIAFYAGLLDFANSDKYVAKEWEPTSIAEKLSEMLHLKGMRLVEKLCGLDKNKLRSILFKADPCYKFTFPSAKNKDEELNLYIETVLNNKELPEGHTVVKKPVNWKIPKDYNSWPANKKITFIKECLAEKAYSYNGTKMKDFRSKLIDKYLKKK